MFYRTHVGTQGKGAKAAAQRLRRINLTKPLPSFRCQEGEHDSSNARNQSGTNNGHERWIPAFAPARAHDQSGGRRRSGMWKQENVMNTAFLLGAAAAMAALSGYGMPAQDSVTQGDGQDAGVFTQWLTANAPECVAVSQISSVSHLTKLTPEQFQFVRALYIAIPPISRQLPPGDSAVIASADGKYMIALVSDGQACARFLAPDFILTMLVQVGRGENALIGQPI
jgi:hypothetical protein